MALPARRANWTHRPRSFRVNTRNGAGTMRLAEISPGLLMPQRQILPCYTWRRTTVTMRNQRGTEIPLSHADHDRLSPKVIEVKKMLTGFIRRIRGDRAN